MPRLGRLYSGVRDGLTAAFRARKIRRRKLD
jgi:hypothetical protein